jgi:hypothetical protein
MNRELVVKIIEEVLEGWNEKDHPRGKGGKFSSDGGGGGEFAIGYSTPAERKAHSKNAGPNSFTKAANALDKKARATPDGHPKKMKRHKEAIRAHKDAVNKGEEKYAAYHETRIRVHERIMRKASSK